MEILVTNIPPEKEEGAGPKELELFQAYVGDSTALPYVHQSLAFKKIKKGESLTLVAGTAAGKTLAATVPLLVKITEGRIKKILFLYPTLALLEDQRQVIEKLAALAGLEGEIGQIRGGMSRSRLLHNLNKKIILATPDAVYWFFRKNIKYSPVLIYGLAQVDEFVLDEAHLFNGLVFQNLCCFFKRIFFLQEQFMQRPAARLHILTATPQEELKTLSNAAQIEGRSKCGEVKIRFLNCGRFEKEEMLEKSVHEAIKTGAHKILVIFNSAVAAHRLFLKQKQAGRGSEDVLKAEYYLQFGRIKQGNLENLLKKKGLPEQFLERSRKEILKEALMCLEDFKAVEVRVKAEELCRALGDVLNNLKGQVARVFYWTFKKKQAFGEKLPGEVLYSNLYKRSPVLMALFKNIYPAMPAEVSYSEVKQILEESWERLINGIEEKIAGAAPGVLTYPGLAELVPVLGGLELRLREAILNRFLKSFSFSLNDIASKKGPLPGADERFIYLKFLDAYFEENAGRVRDALLEELQENPLFVRSIEMRHVATWKGTDYPVIVYTGSMSRRSRGGLINLFDDLEKAVLISTSAVEVGVDFAADVLITEECAAESFLQRFGRVGRTGREARAEVLLGGALYRKLADYIKERAILSREDFSTLVKENFPRSTYLEGSDFIEAAHYLVTEQLGMIGRTVNEQQNYPERVSELAADLRTAGISPAYGLRGTLPQVSLQEENVVRDPFYLLQYVENKRLKAMDSPFEIARAELFFTGLLYTGRFCRVGVDIELTLDNAAAIVLWDGRRYHVRKVDTGQVNGVWNYVKDCYGTVAHKNSALLIYGDVYLARIYEKFEPGKKEPVEDEFGQSIVLRDQFCLLFPRRKECSELKKYGLAGLDEVYYDVDWEGHTFDGENLVLLDRVQGSCLALYRRWLESAD